MVALDQMILGHLLEIKAQSEPEREILAFVYPDHVERLTYGDLFVGAQKIFLALEEMGLRSSDRFGIMMRNHPEFVYGMGAASMAGFAFVPLDPRMKGPKLRYMVENSECRALFCTYDLLGPIRDSLAEAKGLRLLVSRVPAGASLPPECENADRILRSRLAREMGNRVEDGSAIWQIIYTSGTTGDPKGVLCDNNRFGLYGMLGTLVFGYQPTDKLYTGLSLTHGNAQAVTLASSLIHGIPAVISERFTKSRLWDIVREHGCTTFSLLGGMATAIYAEPRRPDDGDNPVRFVVSAGMPRAIWEDFERRFQVKILEWYGAVDGGIAFKPIGEGPVGSFGKPIFAMEMKVVDEQDNECPPGVIGELICRNRQGPTQVDYYKNPEASRAKTRGGWIRTGDMCHRDEDGWLFFDFRKGGGLRHNGDFVSPDYVEKAVSELQEVSDVFCYGVPAASGAPGESDVVVAIVLAEGARFDPDRVFAHCEASLEPNFVPSYLQVVSEIPKTISEKPQERLLRAEFSPDAPNVFSREAYSRRPAG